MKNIPNLLALDNTPIWTFLLYIFPPPSPTLYSIFFDNFSPMTHGINTKTNSWGKVISSCFEDYKTTLQRLLLLTLLYDTLG